LKYVRENSLARRQTSTTKYQLQQPQQQQQHQQQQRQNYPYKGKWGKSCGVELSPEIQMSLSGTDPNRSRQTFQPKCQNEKIGSPDCKHMRGKKGKRTRRMT